METFAKGLVLLVPSPFSDLSRTKLRPALDLAQVEGNDLLLAQITNKSYADPNSIELTPNAFAYGSLERVSFVCRGKLFTASRNFIVSQVGNLTVARLRFVIEVIVILLRKN